MNDPSLFTDIAAGLDLSEVQEQLREDADLGADRLNGYALQQQAYDGELSPPLQDREREFLGAHGVRFTENFHETVVDVHAELSTLEGVRFPGRDELTEWANGTVWQRSNLDAVQAQVSHASVLKGDAFLIVSFDDTAGVPVFEYQRPEQMKVVCDDEGVRYFVKVWNTSRVCPTNPKGRKIRRMNRFFPDRVEKWFTLAANDTEGEATWLPHLDPEDVTLEPVHPVDEIGEPDLEQDPVMVERAAWPTRWTVDGTEDGEPLGFSVFHFPHKAGDGVYGRSLGAGWLPFQNELNKQLVDLFQVMDTQGWKQRYASGVPDTTSLTVAIGEWVTSSDPGARFGEFAAEDPRHLVETLEATIRRGAAKTRTPLHNLLLAGALPSGESLKTAESPAARSANARNVFASSPWVGSWLMAVRLAWVFGRLPEGVSGPVEDLMVELVWADTHSRNEKGEADTAEVWHRIGASARTLLANADFDPEEEFANRVQEQARALEGQARAFDRGDVEPLPGVDEGEPVP